MATSTARRAKKSGSEARVNQRGREILGIVIMAIALLSAIAFVTYSPLDRQQTRELSFGPPAAEIPPIVTRNLLGPFGAGLAEIFVPTFIGYFILILVGLVAAWGYAVFRGRIFRSLPSVTVLLATGALDAAFITGWFQHKLDMADMAWSGQFGFWLSGRLIDTTGFTGSIIFLLLAALVVLLLMIDRDIQQSFDRLEDLLARVGPGMTAWRERRLEAREERRQEKAARKAERDRIDAEAQSAHEMKRRREEARRLRDGDEAPLAPAPVQRPIPVEASEAPPVRRSTPELPFPGQAAEHRDVAMTVKEQIREQQIDADRAKKTATTAGNFVFPALELLDAPDTNSVRRDPAELEENKRILLDKLAMYNIEITSINAIVGPTVTMYELTPAPGVKISRITALEDDLAMAMAARGIRMIAPIPGKTAVGVEIPNRHRELVRIREIIGTTRFRELHAELPAIIGKTIEGEVFVEDLTKMPHLLIAGATGSGKSVGLNTLIVGLMYACSPDDLKFVMIDPKKIELLQFARLSEHYMAMPPFSDDPIITDFTQALGVLKSCEKEMERRYDMLSRATVRGIKDYNKKFAQGVLKEDDGHAHLPYIVVIVDELADLMMTAGKDIEGPIARLAQMARAVGIHLVLATQRPSVDVITGLIKANFPSRIAYQVASKVDSRTILDQNGAQGLVGNGDLLYMNGSRLIRLQGPFVTIDEVDRITHHIWEQVGPGPYELPSIEETLEISGDVESIDDIDDLFTDAARIIVRSQQGSVSLLQRKLSVGYARAARIVDQLETAGIVGPFEGSKARQVLVESEEQLDEILKHTGQ